MYIQYVALQCLVVHLDDVQPISLLGMNITSHNVLLCTCVAKANCVAVFMRHYAHFVYKRTLVHMHRFSSYMYIKRVQLHEEQKLRQCVHVGI